MFDDLLHRVLLNDSLEQSSLGLLHYFFNKFITKMKSMMGFWGFGVLGF